MAKNNLYTENSIESLSPLQFTRLKPGVYCGDTTYSTQLLVEIVSNAIDEFVAGHGDKIEVTVKGAECSVRDYGQGFIYSMREDGASILEAAFSVLNTSGKYKEDGVYEGTSLGSFGIGSKITNFLSHELNVSSCRDGVCETINFKEGVFNNREITKINDNSGTYVHWIASEEFFTYPEIETNKIKDLFETTVCLLPGLTIEYNDENADEKITFFSKNGIDDLVSKEVGKKEILSNRFKVKATKGKNKIDLILTYTKDYSSKIIPYVNVGHTESGPHITQLRTSITRTLNKFFREKKWLKEKDENFTGNDIQEGMVVVFNYTNPNTSYDAQVKSRVVKIETGLITEVLNDDFYQWLCNNDKDVKVIFDKADKARKAREAAKKAREIARKPKKEKGLRAAMQLSDKFIASTKENPKQSLVICEGVSAASSVLEARDASRDNIYLLRGKIISALKTDLGKMLKNQEIHDLIQLIGAGLGDSFDISKTKFNNVVIATDSDVDGAHIELLLLTFFFTYMRPLVEHGFVYRASAPLYTLTKGKEMIHLYSEQEYKEYRETNNVDGYDIVRQKGLAETSATVLHDTCFKNETYRQITIDDCEKAEELLEVLMGKAIEGRKQYIYDNAENYGLILD